MEANSKKLVAAQFCVAVDRLWIGVKAAMSQFLTVSMTLL